MSNVTTIQPLQIEVDGNPLDALADQALKAVSIRQRLSESTACTMTFVDPDTVDFLASCGLRPGARLRLSRMDLLQPVFSGMIIGFEFHCGPAGQRIVTINAHDELYTLHKRQPVKAHVQVTVPELAETMLAGLGISVAAQATGPVWDRIIQHQVSDLAFLKDYAERSGLYFFLLGDSLRLFSLKPEVSDIPLEYRQSLLEVTLKNDSEWDTGSVTVNGWNPWQAEALTGRAQSPPNVEALSAPRTLSNQPAQADAQLDSLAAAVLDRTRALRDSVSGTAEGDFRLTPGTSVRIEGVDAALNGRYLLTAVEHRIDAEQGFVSVFDTVPPKAVSRSQNTLATLARVTQVEDPDRLGRVKVLLPGYNDVESDWLEVVMPGAGANKGLIAFPDIDDRVLVLMLNGRPDQAVVLGGMYGEDGPPDHNVEDNAVHRYSFLTAGGQTIRMNDQGATITLENRSGCRVELSGDSIKLETADGQVLALSDQNLKLHAETDCCIEAPGRTLTLKADKINFERG